jgi:ABC-type transport system involved in multi-copper enzyme maturation permease subunit
MHSILASLLGPMFAKEMVEIARRKRYFLNRVLYGLVLLFTVFLVWDSYGWRFQMEGRASIHLMAELAQHLFHAVSGVQYGAVFVFVPLFLCGVIASEREERTLELLFTTHLTDAEIVLGKFGSRLAVFAFLVLFTLPIMSLVMLFGGVDPLTLWRNLACTLMAVLYAGAHAIYFSTVTKSAMGALVRTYWWMAVWMIGVPMAVMIPISATRSFPVTQFCLCIITLVDPLFTFVLSMDAMTYKQVTSYLGPWLAPWFFPLAFVLPGGWSLFLLWRAVRRLRLAPTALALRLAKMWLVRTLQQDVRESVKLRAKGRQQRAERLWGIYRIRNPLWLRSRLTRVYDREGYIGGIQWVAWVAAAFFLLLLLLSEPRSLRERGCGMAFLVPVWLGIGVLTAIFSGSCLVGDRRRGFLDLVFVTPLKPREIVDGTLLSVWQHMRRLYWLPVLLGAFFCLTGSCTFAGVCASLITGTLFGALLTLHGTACSLTAKTLPGALVPTFLFPLLMCLGIVFLIPIFQDVAGPVLWFLTALALVVTWFWTRRRTSAAAVGCYFMAVHLAIASLASCWAWSGYRHRDEYPFMVINPAYMTIRPLEGDPFNWFRDLPGHTWIEPLVCYWACLLVTFVWARWWLIRHFERLIDRPSKSKPASPHRRKSIVRPPPETVGAMAQE